MKVTGFYLIGGDMVSPTVFRKMLMEKLEEMGFDISKVKEPTLLDRWDIVEFEKESYTKEEVEYLVDKYYSKQKGTNESLIV